MTPTQPKDERIQLLLSGPELQSIDDWRFENRSPSRNEAIRELIRRGLKSTNP